MAMMLRKKDTGDVYVYTELLSRRDDMEVFESEQTPAAVPPQPAKLSAAIKPVVVDKGTGEKP